MPEAPQKLIGIVEARTQKGTGIMLVGREGWLNFTQYEGDRLGAWKPDEAQKGVQVELIVKGNYILGVQAANGQSVMPPGPVAAPPSFVEPVDDYHQSVSDPVPTPERTVELPRPEEWGFKQKDALIFKETCVNAAAGIYRAAIEAGLVKNMPTPDVIHAYAEGIESMGWETLRR